MNYMILLSVMFFSVVLASIWELLFTVFPSWKKMKVEESLLDLAKRTVRINKDALITAKISNGQYLHDVFYKSLLMTLCDKPTLRFNMLKLVSYNEENERARKKFRDEINALDKKTKEIVNEAMYASGMVIFLCNPILFLLFSIKMMRVQKDYKERTKKKSKRLFYNRVIRSTEYYTIYAIEQKELTECYNH